MKGKCKMNKKNIYGLVCICLMLLLLPLSTLAAPPEDGELSLHYPYAGVTFHIYKVASFNEKTGYKLEEPFTEYENVIEGLDRLGALSSDEWRILAYTLENLVGADNIEPTRTMVTDQNGNLIWEDIPKGLYLILGDTYETKDTIYTPAPILINVPNYDENGNWNYIVKVEHNKIEEEEKEETIDIPVIKIWLDCYDKDNKRPDSIKVGLYKDGKLYDVVELSVENNWRYRWRDLLADADWHIKELNVPSEYKTYYVLACNKIAIYNKYEPEEPPADEPTTGTEDEPTTEPEDEPTTEPEDEPTTEPEDEPTTEPEDEPTTEPEDEPTTGTEDEPTTGTEDEPTTGTEDEPTTEPEDEPTTEVPNVPDKPKIPQTGQLWWPIPILVVVGLLMITLGWIKNADGE